MNVKPGDLAIIIKSDFGNEGSIVEVLRPHMRVSSIGPMWVVQVMRDTPCVNMDTGLALVIKAGAIAACDDAWLRPVSGLPDADENETYIPKEKEQS